MEAGEVKKKKKKEKRLLLVAKTVYSQSDAVCVWMYFTCVRHVAHASCVRLILLSSRRQTSGQLCVCRHFSMSA